MSIEKCTIEIGPHTYTVTQLDALKGRKAFVKLVHCLGPAFSSTTPQEVISNLLANLREEDMEHFCDLFAGVTSVTGGEYADREPQLGTKTVFGTHFAGNYLAMFEWLVFCVTSNFGSFFGGISGLVEKYAPVEPAKVTTPASP